MARTGSWPERSQGTSTTGAPRGCVAPIDEPESRSIAFVLPGGASRGATQVGMLLALTECGIRPDLVVGTSVGALNGACFAADATVAGLERIAERWVGAPRDQIFPFSWRGAVRNIRRRADHLLPNDGLRRWIEANTAHAQLEDLPIPVHVVTTNVATGKPVVVSSGDVVTALLASTAIPRVFPPVTIDGLRLFDGAVAANTPVDEAIELGATDIFVLPAAADSPFEAAMWRTFDRVFGGPPAEPVARPDHVRITELPAPRALGSPYSFRSSRPLIDQARDLTRSFLAGDDRSAPPWEVQWPSLTQSPASSTLHPASA
jgi:NTE family protein